MIPSVAYFRMSSARQETSIPQQKAWAETAAKLHGLQVLRSFEDEAIPGDELERRGGFLAMIEFCRERHAAGSPVEAVLCFDADRFSRASSLRTAAVLCQLIDAGTTKMVTAEGVVDFESDVDLMVFNIKQDASKAAYSKLLSRRVTIAAIRRAQEGKWNGGPCPYGFQVGPDGFLQLAEPEKAETVRWLFQTYASRSTSLKRLSETLIARGAPPPRSGRWTKSAVWHVLANVLYTGDYYYARLKGGKYHRVSNGQAVSRRPQKTHSGRLALIANDAGDAIVVPDTHPSLVSRETFAVVQHKLKQNMLGGERAKSRPRVEWPLAGLLECPDCKLPLWGFRLTDKRSKATELRRYRCQTYTEKGRDACHATRCRRASCWRRSATRSASDSVTPSYWKRYGRKWRPRRNNGRGMWPGG
jgi:DNA invertase Pin-like site-specific DNA recombinase